MTPRATDRIELRIDARFAMTHGFVGNSGARMRISTGIAAALAVGLAPVGAYAATAPAGQELVFHGSAYGFWNPRPDDLEFHLSNTTIRFRMGLDFDVLRWLQASQRTGASIAVLINPAVGEFEDSSTDPTFPALRIAINGAHQQVRPGSHQPLIGRRPGPVPLSVHSLAEAIALRESGQPGAAGPFIDEALADPALRPALKAVALHTRALIAAGADADSEGAPTGTGDVALMKALGDLDLAVSLAPEDVDTANFRGYVLAGSGRTTRLWRRFKPRRTRRTTSGDGSRLLPSIAGRVGSTWPSPTWTRFNGDITP